MKKDTLSTVFGLKLGDEVKLMKNDGKVIVGKITECTGDENKSYGIIGGYEEIAPKANKNKSLNFASSKSLPGLMGYLIRLVSSGVLSDIKLKK